jgi:hypothetical protein
MITAAVENEQNVMDVLSNNIRVLDLEDVVPDADNYEQHSTGTDIDDFIMHDARKCLF